MTVAPGLGGASNNGANQITASVGVNTSYTEPGLIEPLVVAELAEIFMAAQNNGWFAGWSNGEALSRVSGQVLYPENAWGFATGSSWFNPGSVGNLPDWVDNVEQTDQDYVSIGCGSLFLNYLAYQLNVTSPAICKAGAPSTHTLAETAGIVGAAGGYAGFKSLLQTNFPSGNLYSAATPFDQRLDDVFPLGQMPAQLPALYMRNNTTNDANNHGGPLSTVPTSSLGTPQSRTLRRLSRRQHRSRTPTRAMRMCSSGRPTISTCECGMAEWPQPRTSLRQSTMHRRRSLVTPSMWTLHPDQLFPSVPTAVRSR